MFKYLLDATIKSRNIMINCTRKACDSKKFPYHCWMKLSVYQRLLEKNLFMDIKEVNKLLRCQQQIFNIPKDHLAKQCRLCVKLNIDTSTLFTNAELLGWSGPILENRILLLQEMGVKNMHASLISNYYSVMHLSMSMFKAWAGIPISLNVARNLLKHLDLPPAGVPPFKTPSNNLSINDYHKHCWQWYVQWKFQIPAENTNEMNRVMCSLRHRSFRVVRRLFNILHCELGFTIKEIIQYDFLRNGSPNDLRKIIDDTVTFENVDIKKLIKKVPALHKMDYENAVGVIKHLEKRGFNKKSIKRNCSILTIPKSKVAASCNKFESTPELRVLRNNRNALKLICQFDKVHIRLSYIRYLNIKYATVRTLTARSWNFEKFINTGMDKSKGREMGISFEKLLKLESNDIRRRIEKHPYWRHIDLATMHDSLKFLLKRFTPEDLHDNLQLILYPREKIREALDRLPEVQEALRTRKENQDCSPGHILAMCMYEIEREHHFTGDGIWKYETPSPQLIDISKTDDNKLSDHSDYVNSETEDINRTTS